MNCSSDEHIRKNAVLLIPVGRCDVGSKTEDVLGTVVARAALVRYPSIFEGSRYHASDCVVVEVCTAS